VAVPWRVQGRLLQSASAATDLYDFSARSYDPSLGSFTSLDSVAGSAQNPLTLNRYLYALANPARFIDPTGHDAVDAETDACANGWIPADYCEAHGHPTPGTTSSQIVTSIAKKKKADAQALLSAYSCIEHPELCENEPTTEGLYAAGPVYIVHVVHAPRGDIFIDEDGRPMDELSLDLADYACNGGDDYDPTACAVAKSWGHDERLAQSQAALKHAALEGFGLLAMVVPGGQGVGAAAFGADAGIYASEGNWEGAILSGLAAAPGVMSLIKTMRGIGSEAAESPWLYRGVAEDHPGFDDALNGIARPRGGTATPLEHNIGNTNSPYTSWSTSLSTAEGFAGNRGVVLRIANGNGPGYTLVVSPDWYGEGEVLVQGTVTNAAILPGGH
jgi:RHS repeat-associated protein